MPRIDALGDSSSVQKGALSHQAIEDYLKTIYVLGQAESPVSTSRIAEARGVKPGSVTGMIKRLDKLNLVHYQKHYGVTLTESGERIALEVLRHHRLLETYLMEALGFGWDEVHEQADVLEHVISEKLEERIAAVLDYPKFDPHGAPIPQKDGTMPRLEALPLTEAGAGTAVRVARIARDEDATMLQYLETLGLMPGTMVEVVEHAPFDGPVTVRVGDKLEFVGFNVASAVLVAAVERGNGG